MTRSCSSLAGRTGWGRRSRIASSKKGPGSRCAGGILAGWPRPSSGWVSPGAMRSPRGPTSLDRRPLDGLVNNAGKSPAGRIDQVSDDEWIAALNLKVLAAVRATRLTVPHLIAAGGGAIVNVLNIGAKAAGAGSLPSAASRAAGLAITKAASRDLGGQGIRVNAVVIGLVESGQGRGRAGAAGQSEEELYRQMAGNAGIPLGRVGRSAEFADLVTYLLSDRSSYVTVSAINLDGGSSPVL